MDLTTQKKTKFKEKIVISWREKIQLNKLKLPKKKIVLKKKVSLV